ncbi:DNase I-like protein [Basidiobolus meristosporus CBS 931.73]|uniref:DNase I-like protein n=1 Tax=Basidiobolus meristosporus CBS 931.73 TaxID=1314790 RepID=A0A1Y1XXL4_9FUNG|nr:DNase I-like protein [Basidiobolus meristosporus CBS 931.73]|eukprot:ORX90482.1 DNase I-like protein [Basidiobolus meristosporus CBS 931.73]
MTSEISVFTLNCWGLKFVSQKRRQRLNAIAQHLAESEYDIVGLQEVWVFEDFEMIRRVVSEVLPYARFFHTGVFGAGLAIFSKFPIVNAFARPYSLNGNPLKILQGDWYVAKAVACCHLSHPTAGVIEVYNTHLIAQYSSEDENAYHRAAQGWELSRLLTEAARNGNHIIALGDYNSIPDNLVINMLKNYAGLTDSWDQMCGVKTRGTSYNPNLSVEDIVRMNGLTCDVPSNTFTKQKLKQQMTNQMPGERLDYIFYSQSPYFRCKDSQVCLTGLAPGLQCSYSDHFAVVSQFEISNKASGVEVECLDAHVEPNEGPGDSDKEVNLIEALLHLVWAGLNNSHQRRNGYYWRFWISFTALIVLYLVTVIAQPVSWVIALLNLLLLALALYAFTFFLVSILYARQEDGAFRRIFEDVDTVKNVANSVHISM